MGRVKNVFTIEQDLPFLKTLAAELWQRTGGDGFKLSQHMIFLPTRRACRLLGIAFAEVANGKPVLLPRMRPLGDIDEDEMAFADDANPDHLPAIPPLKRLMLLTQQVKRREPGLSWDQAALAAEALAKFLDQVEIENCDIADLPKLVQDQQLAQHWQETLLFLEIVTKHWPDILKERGFQDPVTRRNAIMQAQAEVWQKAPPQHPVIAAGSTGTIPSTAALLNVIASLPQGAVILPGLDRNIENEAWEALDETHPQHSMKKLLERMKIYRKDVKPFSLAPQPRPARVRLLSESMRPAKLTDAWRQLQGKLDTTAIEGLTRLTLDHPQEEAQVIALRLRQLLETPQKTAAFVTGDRNLASRVASLLQRWCIKIDDSGGAPVLNLPVGAFLNLVLAASSPYAGAVNLLALLKHPFAACGLSPADCRAKARRAEVQMRKIEEDKFDELRKILRPLTQDWHTALPLPERIKKHIDVAEAIAASDTERGADRLWQDESGEDAADWLHEWQQAASDLEPLSGEDYLALFSSLAARKTLRSARTTHPRLSILGTLEARLCDADLVILGGMNEGTWPPDPGFDPWMSRPMREKFKLPQPEYRIGLSAHDFVHLASAKEVMITRSTRADGVPTVPSRFLLQIETVLQASGLASGGADILAPAEPWRDWAHALDEPENTAPCERPAPCPPVDVRPTSLSVTEISTWLRNPYAIYAKHILKLKKLDELDEELDASDKGNMIHEALEQFTRTFPDRMPPDAEERLLALGRHIFAQDKGDPRVKAFWESGFAKIAAWFIEQDRERRAKGISSVSAEAKGKHQVDTFTLTGRADRIEKLSDGSVCIVDYKTGGIPKKEEVEAGIEPQLQLLALIAQAGGFEGIQPANVAACNYWALKSGKTGCKISPYPQEIESLVEQAETGLKSLIAAFNDPSIAYEASPRARFQPRHNDYAHLSRAEEWGKAGEDS
jgi:ATP-dependent helicase/nuclease subunit B